MNSLLYSSQLFKIKFYIDILLLMFIFNHDMKALKTLAGIILIKLATGIVTIWGSINLYFLSYFHEKGQEVNSSTNSILMLAVIFPMSIIILFAPKIAEHVGHQRTIRLSATLFLISPFFLNLTFNILSLTVFCIFIPATAFAISSISVFYCLWIHFPTARNQATAVAVVCFGLGGIVWNFLFMMLTNPENKNATIFDSDLDMHFFDTDVTQNIYSSIRIGFFCAGILYVLGSLLISEKTTEKVELVEIQMEDLSRNNQLLDKTDQEIGFFSALKSAKFIYLFVCSFLSGLFQIFIYMNVKILYMPFVQNDHFLAYCVMIGAIFSMFGSFCWGYFGDKHGFFFTLLCFALSECGIKLFACFSFTKPMIMCMFILLGLTDKGMLTLMGPGMVQLFGIKTATQLLPYKGISIFLGFAAAPLIYLLLLPILSPYQFLLFLWVFSLVVLLLVYRLYSNKV